MKAKDFNAKLGRTLREDKAVIKPRGRVFRLTAIIVVTLTVIVGVFAW